MCSLTSCCCCCCVMGSFTLLAVSYYSLFTCSFYFFVIRKGMLLSSLIANARRNLRPQSLRHKSEKAAPVPFVYQELFDLGDDTTTKYRKLTSDYVSTITTIIKEGGVSKTVEFLKVRNRLYNSRICHLSVLLIFTAVEFINKQKRRVYT